MAIRNIKVQYDSETGLLTFKASNGDDLTTAIKAAILAETEDGGVIDDAIDTAIATHAG